jgi:hypothetical protein
MTPADVHGRYNRSEKGRARQRRYRMTAKGRANERRAHLAWDTKRRQAFIDAKVS